MKNWLEIAVGVYLLGMVLYGHYRGAVRLAVSMVSLVVSLLAVRLAMPYVTDFIRDNTPVHGWIEEKVSEAVGIDQVEEETSGSQMPEDWLRFIEELKLPDEWKETLIENGRAGAYQMPGVDALVGYIGSYLADSIIHLAGFVILFIVVYVGLKLLAGALNVVARLPVLSGMNQLAGALLGGLQGLIFLWLAFLLITACSTFSWAASLLEQIEASSWLSFLYRYNLISRLALGIIRGI